MASIEEMLMGIFDTRNRIVRQLREQQQLFDDALHSSLFLRGVRPPTWLSDAKAVPAVGIGDRCHPGSKEDVFPGLPMAHHKWTVNSSVRFYTQRKRPDAVCSIETQDYGKEFIMDNVSTVMGGESQKPNDNQACSHNPNIGPPLQTAGMATEVYVAPDRSLEKITRSRSRQRALEKRNSEKKQQGDEKKAAPIEYTGRITRSRLTSQQSSIRVNSVNPLKHQNQKDYAAEKIEYSLNAGEGVVGDQRTGCRIFRSGSSPKNRATQEVHDGSGSPPCVLPSFEMVEAEERQPVNGNTLAIQPKELMFDDVEDCSVKEMRADLDEQVLEIKLLEKHKIEQSKSADLTNGEDISDQTQREIVVSAEGQPDNKRVQIGITVVDTSEGDLMHEALSSDEELENAGELVDSKNIQPREADDPVVLPQVIYQPMSPPLLQNEVSEVTLINSVTSSLEHLKNETVVETEAASGDIVEVNRETARFSLREHLEVINLSDLASLHAREQDASVVTKRRITRSMSACFLNGGGNSLKDAAPAMKLLKRKTVVQMEAIGLDPLDVNQKSRVFGSGKQLQKVNEFVDSEGIQISDVDSSVEDMVQETNGVALFDTVDENCSVLNISPKYGKRGSKARYFLQSPMAGNHASKLRHSALIFSGSDLNGNAVGNVYGLPSPECRMQQNNDNQLNPRAITSPFMMRERDNLQSQNDNAESASGISEAREKSHNCPSNQVHAEQSNLDVHSALIFSGSDLNGNDVGNVYGLPSPECRMQQNNDNQLNPRAITSPFMMRERDNLQSQNDNAESASGISEAREKSHNCPSNQVHAEQSNLDVGFDDLQTHRCMEQYEMDQLEPLPPLQAAHPQILVQEVEHNLEEDQPAATHLMLQKISVDSSHSSEIEEQADGASDLLVTNKEEKHTDTGLNNANCSDRLLQFDGAEHETMNVDYSIVETFSLCGPVMNKIGDAGKYLEEKQCCSEEKGFVSPSCYASPTSFYDPPEYSGRHSSSSGVDKSLPVLEGFSVGVPMISGQPAAADNAKLSDYFDFSSFRKPAVGGLQTCKSTSFLTPRPNASVKYKVYSTPDIYQSLPNRLLEHIDFKGSFLYNAADLRHIGMAPSESGDLHDICSDFGLQIMDGSSLRSSYCGSGFLSDVKLGRGIRSPAASTPATGKISEKTLLKSNGRSSGKQLLKNPELICFRIEEETNMNEENEHMDLDDISEASQKRICLGMKKPNDHNVTADITMSHCSSSDINAEGQPFLHRNSPNLVNIEVDFVGKEVGVSEKHNIEQKYNIDDKENRDPSLCAGGSKKVSHFIPNRFSKPKLTGNVGRGNGSQTFTGKDRKLNNIVANISSFIPLVQQKKPVAGKRDIKVRALEAAEAAKRLEEKKETEKKMRKEAAKLEREKLMLENLKQTEEQRRREEEKKQKKMADLARRRQREEEEKKEKERKRRLIEESRKQFRLAEEEKELQRKVDKDECKRKEAKRQKIEKGQQGTGQMQVTFSGTGNVGANDTRPSELVRGECEAVGIHMGNGKVGSVSNSLASLDKCGSLSIEESEEMQYEMSPYRGSDDEEEEEEDLSQRKFIPSWARKENLIPILSRQQHVDPDDFFPSIKGCNLSEVLGSNNFSRYRDRNGRSESGCWLNDRFTQQEEYQYKLKMGYLKL